MRRLARQTTGVARGVRGARSAPSSTSGSGRTPSSSRSEPDTMGGGTCVQVCSLLGDKRAYRRCPVRRIFLVLLIAIGAAAGGFVSVPKGENQV